MSKKHILKINNCRNSMSLGIVVTLSRTTDFENLKSASYGFTKSLRFCKPVTRK